MSALSSECYCPVFDTEIWLVHSGCGKTFASQQRNDVLDFAIGEYKYLHPLKFSTLLESEQVKACDGELNPEWPWNYIDAVMQAYGEKRYRYIFVPVITRLADVLRMNEIPYTLVYPDLSLKREYKKRYIERGNNEGFLEVFIGHWEYWNTIFKVMMCPDKRIVLQSGQYLTDVLEKE